MVAKVKWIVPALILSSVLAAQNAAAKVYVNSTCQMRTNSTTIEGDSQKAEKFPLASISKLVTSLWAVEHLGVNYRYNTKFHISRVGNDTYDIHIEGGRDPIFGRNAAYFILSELNRKEINVKKVENITFDENFLLDWRAEESPRIGGDTPYYDTLEKQTAAVRRSLLEDFGTAIRANLYNTLRKNASKIGVTMHAKPTISIRRAEFKAKADFVKPAQAMTLSYQSAPLRTILKRMNNQSNNYIADHIFWNLGGTPAFNKYIESALSMSAEDFDFVLGSGNNAGYILDPKQNIYNMGTCEAMIKSIYRLDHLLTRQGYRLFDVMSVAGVDKNSTVGAYDGNFDGTTAAKTGSVNKAKTLAGMISTRNGEIYFVILVNTDGPSEWGRANNMIRSHLNNMIVNNGGGRKISYTEILPLPFDKESVLRRISTDGEVTVGALE